MLICRFVNIGSCEVMVEEKRGRKVLGIMFLLRYWLLNIINFVNSSSWFNENEFVKNMCSNSEL